jgi:hypothetical protein
MLSLLFLHLEEWVNKIKINLKVWEIACFYFQTSNSKGFTLINRLRISVHGTLIAIERDGSVDIW